MGAVQAQRREEILQAAAEVIGERGVCETRIGDIAERAGVSPGLVVYYFGSKDRLLADALAYAEDGFYQKTMRELEALSSARDRLVRLIELGCPPDAELPDWTLWIELWSRAMRDPAAAKTREELDQLWRSTIAEIVRAGRHSMEFAPVDVDDFVLRLACLMDGLTLQVLLRDPTVSTERMRIIVLGMAARELGFELPEELPTAPPPASRR